MTNITEERIRKIRNELKAMKEEQILSYFEKDLDFIIRKYLQIVLALKEAYKEERINERRKRRLHKKRIQKGN